MHLPVPKGASRGLERDFGVGSVVTRQQGFFLWCKIPVPNSVDESVVLRGRKKFV